MIASVRGLGPPPLLRSGRTQFAMRATTRLVAICSALAAMPVSGQEQAIEGIVAELQRGHPVARAAVLLLDAENSVLAATLTSDSGSFRLEISQPGSYHLRVSRVGYRPTQSASIEVRANTTVQVRVNLRPDAVALEGVTVRGDAALSRELAGFWRRRNQRRGYNFTRADFERLGAATVADVLITVPGYRPVGGSIVREEGRARSLSLNFRRCPPVVYVDGYASKFGLWDLFGGLPLSHIYGVEVFRNWSDVPAEFGGTGRARCGVIVVWTVAMER